MLLFTPALTSALNWFELCYALDIGVGVARWRRVALPTGGGLGEQPAKLLATLAWVAQVKNTLLWQASRRRREKVPEGEE